MHNLFWVLVFTLSLDAGGQSLQNTADSIRLKYQIPELGFAVIAPDTILDLQVCGFHRTDLENETTKANRSDYFHLGSNTKAITGFLAACLVSENRIAWSTKFFDLFPGWKNNSNPGYYDITLSDLLSHRARIQPYTSGLEYQELPEFSGTTAERRQQFVKYVLHEKPVNSKRIYNYSNAGYAVAALMLEKVTGKTWELLIKDIMLNKAHVDVEFGFPNKIGPNEPSGHWLENDTLKAVGPETDYNLALAEPAGDISMTLPDYAKFIQLNLQGLLGKDNILPAATYNYLHFGLPGYSIGWSNAVEHGKPISDHAGSAGTFFCYALLDKTNKLAYVIVANAATTQAQKGIFELLNVLKDKFGK